MAKKTLRFLFACVCGKITIKLLRLLKKNATNLPGSVVLTLCPDFLKYLELPEKIIAVTGTNGKTTVSNMLLDILTDNGYDCTNNNFGGNVDTGITTALLKDSTLSGKAKKKYCILEIDERSALRIYPYIHPDYLVCTNLTRDSYKRNAHVEYIFDILNKNIPDSSHLILDCDDLISCRLKKNNKRTYFGMECFDDEVLITDNIVNDVAACPECNSPVEYDFRRYHHIGRAHCTKCGLESPAPDFDIVSREFTDDGHAHITMNTPDGEEKYTVACENTINLYNACAAITLLRTFGLSYEQVKNSFMKTAVVKSRFTSETINGKKLVFNLAKGQNPVACSHACNLTRQSNETKTVIVILDDYYDAKTTSENIAWIYDTDFEFLNNDSINKIIIGGKRSVDYKLRMLIGGIPEEKIVCCDREEDTAELVDLSQTESVYVLFEMYNFRAKDVIEAKLKEMMENA
ncbi:MAG: MurT ligase domain-containing protein [Oscillospiraceae bacterium]|nr:MurT ligase domain-containing protein [Oscillospiraceae bacterium]